MAGANKKQRKTRAFLDTLLKSTRRKKEREELLHRGTSILDGRLTGKENWSYPEDGVHADIWGPFLVSHHVAVGPAPFMERTSVATVFDGEDDSEFPLHRQMRDFLIEACSEHFEEIEDSQEWKRKPFTPYVYLLTIGTKPEHVLDKKIEADRDWLINGQGDYGGELQEKFGDDVDAKRFYRYKENLGEALREDCYRHPTLPDVEVRDAHVKAVTSCDVGRVELRMLTNWDLTEPNEFLRRCLLKATQPCKDKVQDAWTRFLIKYVQHSEASKKKPRPEESDDTDPAKNALINFRDQYVGVKEAAEILEVDRTRIQQYARDGRLGTAVAGRYVFTLQELNSFAANPDGKHLEK